MLKVLRSHVFNESDLVRMVIVVVTVAAIGYADYLTGSEIRIYPLYFLPVALSAWSGKSGLALSTAVIATAAWGFWNLGTGPQAAGLEVWSINTLAQFISFSLLGLLTARTRRYAAAERKAARIDAVTALLNVRGFFEQLRAEIDRTRRYKRPFTLAYLDLDNFKRVNDTLGHQTGDQVLRVVSDCLRGCSRATDVVGRLGGDEFALLLPETPYELAGPLLERHRAGVEAVMAVNSWPVTVTIGAATFVDPSTHIGDLVKVVDDLMYSVKKGGKNRVRHELIDSISNP